MQQRLWCNNLHLNSKWERWQGVVGSISCFLQLWILIFLTALPLCLSLDIPLCILLWMSSHIEELHQWSLGEIDQCFSPKFPSLGTFWNIISSYFCLYRSLKCNRLLPREVGFWTGYSLGRLFSHLYLWEVQRECLDDPLSIINYSLRCVCSLGSC